MPFYSEFNILIISYGTLLNSRLKRTFYYTLNYIVFFHDSNIDGVLTAMRVRDVF